MSSQNPPQPPDAVYTLSKIEYLYNAPDKDVFSPNASELRGESAFERFLREHRQDLKSATILPRLVIKLPADQITPGLEEKTRDGLRRYAAQTIYDNRLVLHILRVKGFRQALNGMVFLGVCLTIAFGFSLVEGSTAVHSVAQILVQGFTVIGWVGLWHPVEILLFDWIPYRQQNKVLGHLQRLEIKILPLDLGW